MSVDRRVDDDEQLVLSDLLNRVLDRGVVITGTVTVSVAGVDLIRLGLNIFIAAIETQLQESAERDRSRPPLFNAHVPLLRPPGGT